MSIDPGVRRVYWMAAALAFVVLIGSCGSPTTPPPPPTTTTTLPPPRVVSQGADSLEAGFIGQVAPFTTTLPGAIDVTVEWTLATNDVDVALLRGVCTAQQFLDAACDIAAFSISVTAKPERIRLANGAPGTYTIMLANEGPGDESLSWQAVLTPSASSASTAEPAKGLPLPEKLRDNRPR